MTTLEEAITLGRGIERPFQCFEHPDTTASASVNVLKNVWYCYACGGKGVVDGNRVPTNDELLAMLEPEAACREYASSFLEVYGHGGYWLERFPDWLCWWGGFGEDPWTGDGVFPVHTPRGRLAGIGRRASVPGPGPRYKYPHTWSASRTLWGSRGVWRPQGHLVLVEGAADAASLWQVGIPAFACYGAGLHKPQYELVAQMSPQLVLLGFDMDEAGDRATDQTERMLRDLCEVAPIEWKEKDPADTSPEDRYRAVLEAVGPTGYGQAEVEMHARHLLMSIKNAYVEETG